MATSTLRTRASGAAFQRRLGKFSGSAGTGTGASVDAWRFGFPMPGQPEGTQGLQVANSRLSQYEMGWMTYNNSVFENYMLTQNGIPYENSLRKLGPLGFYSWSRYLQIRDLYMKTKAFYNPVRRLVDFYAGQVFPGVLSDDGSTLPDGMSLAIPLSKDTDERLKSAIAQGWEWNNWGKNKGLWIRYCAATGDGPLEIIDDVENGIVYADPVWPGEITQVSRDGRGHVTFYERVQRVYDEEGFMHYDSRVVTMDTIETYRDGAPFAINGQDSSYDNPYGFCPLVWNCHVDLKTCPGGTAVRDWNKIEKLNSTATRVDRYLHRQARTPMFLPGMASVQSVKMTAEAEEEVQLFTSDGEGAPVKMDGNLDLDACEVRIESMLQEIEHDHPEIVMYSQLRGMSQVTGPAAEQLMGDVAGHLTEARTGYDEGEKRKDGMIIAISAMRYKEGKGGWADRTPEQAKFASFKLEDYLRGNLRFSIDPRPLMQETRTQRAESTVAVAASYSSMTQAGFPLPYQLGEYGENWDAAQLASLQKAQADEQQQAMEAQQQMQGMQQAEQELSQEGPNDPKRTEDLAD